MKALITGADGFVGGYLSEYLLKQNIEVYGTYLRENESSNSKIEYCKMDITNKEEVSRVLESVKPDYIYHLAAQSSAAISWKNPQLTMEVNINGTLNLLEAIREVKINPRILLIGSSEEYGYVKPEDIPVNESQDLRPGNPYAISKIAQSMIGELYVKAYDMDIVMIRAFNHIGPKQSEVFVTSDFAKRIAQIEKGLIDPVLFVGNLESERDFTDVRDIIRAYYLLSQKGMSGEVYNVGSGKSCKIQYILDALLNLSDSDIEVKRDSNRMRPSDVLVVQCDKTKLVETISWMPEYRIEETLEDIINYWRKVI